VEVGVWICRIVLGDLQSRLGEFIIQIQDLKNMKFEVFVRQAPLAISVPYSELICTSAA